jgi:hypothetical protein
VERSKNSELTLPRLAIVSAAFAASLLAAPLWPIVSIAGLIAPPQVAAKSRSSLQGARLAQDDDDSVPDEDAVPTDQVDKYIAVYAAMQKNHSLTVEQAASKQGLTVDEFRTLEDKIERNPTVHERVLDALKASATGAKPSASASSESK